MFQQTSYSEQLTFFQKLRSFDYILLLCIIIIGVISAFSMYSTDGGEMLYHSKSHIIRLLVFFSMMIVLSFLSIEARRKLICNGSLRIVCVFFYFCARMLFYSKSKTMSMHYNPCYIHTHTRSSQVFPKKHSRKLGGGASASTDKLPYFSKLFNVFL